MNFSDHMRLIASWFWLDRLPLISHWCQFSYHEGIGICHRRTLHRGVRHHV